MPRRKSITSPPRSEPVSLRGSFLALTFFGAFAFFYLFLPPLFADTDTPWHIATGQLILQTGGIPLHDPWSFSAPGEFWLNYSWGWDVLVGIVHRLFGLEGVFVFSALWTTGLVTLLGVVLLKRGGVSQDPVMITLAVVAMVLLANLGCRPQSFSCLAALTVHAMLHWNRSSGSPQRILWMLPLFMVLWVNMHSGFMFGFIILGAYGLEAIMRKDRARIRLLVATGALCFAAIHVTPLFPALGFGYLPALYTSLSSEVNQYISEWHPYRFQLYAGFDILLLVLFLSANFHDRKVPVADRILTAAWTVAALSSVRYFPLLALVAAPMLALRLEASLLHKSDSPLLKPAHGKLAWAGALLACALLAASPARKLFTDKDTVIDVEQTPVAALEFLREHYAGVHFFNSWGFGGYMIYYNGEKNPVYIDGRGVTAYPDAVLQVAIDSLQNKLPDTADIQGYFLRNNESRPSLSALERDPSWKLVYRDDLASVVVRTKLAGVTGKVDSLKKKTSKH